MADADTGPKTRGRGEARNWEPKRASKSVVPWVVSKNPAAAKLQTSEFHDLLVRIDRALSVEEARTDRLLRVLAR